MRETRYLWVKNFPDNVQEEKVSEYFKRYGRIEKVKLVSQRSPDESVSAIIAFVDIRSAQHAQSSLNLFGDKQLQITYSDPAAMSSLSNRRGADQSPSSLHRSHSSHRSEMPRSFDGYSGDRAYSSDRHRGTASPSSYKPSDYSEVKSVPKRKDSKNRNVASSSKLDRKTPKMEPGKMMKKKSKKQIEGPKTMSKGKMPRPKEYSSKKKVSSSKKKLEVSSSDDSDEDESSTSDSDGSSHISSTESTATSDSSSSSNSDSSSSPSSLDSAHGEQKLVTIIIKKLPSRPSVNNLRDGIYHEFKKCGKVKSVVIRGDNNSRNALVLFRNASEANKAIGHAKTKLLFGAAIEASLYDGEVTGKELQECGGIIDEFHPRASRTLFVGNLDKTVQYSDLQNIFVRFGEIVALDIKKMFNVPQYAFLQYTDIASVVKAIQKMDGEMLGKNCLKLGFGKTVMSSCVWVEGVTDGFTEHYLASCFHKYGSVKRVIIDRTLGQALVFYPQYEHSQKAINNLRGRNLNGSRLKLDYASHELVEVFLSRMQRSGQSVTTFESIRHLLLPTPSGPGIPSSNPASSGSRSVRSTSTHPYPARADPYYENMHPSRYHPPPHGYDAGLPPRGDWRPWDERSRGRPVYQSVSPRGRRYNDDREYYHREPEHFDRIPGRYEQDYRGPDYIRKEEYSSRPYGDDYHRSMKPRDHREPYHVTPPGRVIHRRSRSISPRLPPSGRAREFESKSDIRSREHRDHSLSRGRSPIKSPKDRGPGPVLKYRDHPSHSPSVYARRDDERRVELRDPKSLPGSPRSVGGSIRGKTIADSPDSRSMGSWSGCQPPAQNRHDVELLAPWDIHNYERSRSETPTRDENTATLGEVIIKQPSAATVKQDASRNDKRDETSKKKKVKQETSPDSNQELLLQRKYSLPNESHKKKKGDKEIARESKHKKHKQHLEESEKVIKKSKTSIKEEKHKKHSSESKAHYSKKLHNKVPALIKREYSPSSIDESGNEQKRRERRGSEQDGAERNTTAEPSRKRQDKHSKGLSSEIEANAQKKRKHSQATADDSDHNSPFYKSSSESHDSKLKRSYSENSDEIRSSKRSRKCSTLHEAPIPVASQSFMSAVDEDSAASIDSDVKEPSAEFRPKLEVREEIIEVAPESDEEDISLVPEVVQVERKEKKSRWEREEKRAAPNIAQPFHAPLNPLMTSQTELPAQSSTENQDQVSDESPEASIQSTESKEKLSRLEEEKAQLQALLSKLDSKQELLGDEVSQVADVYLDNIKSKHTKKSQKTPASDENSPTKLDETTPSGEDETTREEAVEEVNQTIDIPEMIEEQTIVEEEVTSNDEMVYCDTLDATSTAVPEVQRTSDSKETQRTEDHVSERIKAKQQRSLLRKQKKDRERHKRKVDKMRGPSQNIISSIVDEESQDDSGSIPEEICSQPPTQSVDETKPVQSSSKDDVTETSPVMSQEETTKQTDELSKSKIEVDDVTDCDSKSKLPDTAAFAVPLSRDSSTPGSTPKSAKTETVSPGLQKIFPAQQDEGSRTSSSPFTPKTAAQIDKMSHSSGRSSTSLTPLTPSPKTKVSTTSAHRPSSKTQGDRKSHDERRKKAEHTKSMQKHDSRHWKMKTPTRYFTNLTVPRETDHSKPLDKKELDRLRIEVAKVKKELDREMAQGFLSPSAEGDSEIPPMSPILKSPSIDAVTSDPYGRSGTSPLIASSPSGLTSQSVANASSLTERMKLLGKVKKKFKSEEESSGKKPPDLSAATSQDRKEFGNSRFFKSSIFDQDSQRLSHLHTLPQSNSSRPQTSTFPRFDSGELPEDKPLFSDIAQKTESIVSYDSSSVLPKNVSPLSTDVSFPAHAESHNVTGAGIIDSGAPSERPDDAAVTPSITKPSEASGTADNLKLETEKEVSLQVKNLPSTSEPQNNPESKVTEEIGGQQAAVAFENIDTDSQVKLSEADVDSAKDDVEMLIDDVPSSAEVEVKDQVLEEVKNEDDSAKNVQALDVSQAVHEAVDSSAGDVIDSQDSYVCDVTDVVTTEVVSSDPDFISHPEIIDDMTIHEVVAQDVEEAEEGTENESKPSTEDVTSSPQVDSESTKLQDELDQDKMSENCEVHESFSSTGISQLQQTSVLQIVASTSAKSDKTLPIEEAPLESAPLVALLSDTLKSPSISADAPSYAAASSDVPSTVELLSQSTPKLAEGDNTNTVISTDSAVDLPTHTAPKKEENNNKTNDNVKKSDVSAAVSVSSKPVSKVSADGKEKKLEKKLKIDKIKKEKKEEKKHTSKEHSSKSDKLQQKISGKTEKPRDKIPSKKFFKEEKSKQSSTSSSKPKPFETKSSKSAEISSAPKHETADDKHRKKEVKAIRKPGENSQSSGAVGGEGKTPHGSAQKPLKVVEKSKTNVESDKKGKIHKQDTDKKKEQKQKHPKDEKPIVQKKVKDDIQKEKAKQVLGMSKKHIVSKEQSKKEKQKNKDPISKEQAAKTLSKSKLKVKSSKSHSESHQEPAKKKPKLDESILAVTKPKHQSSMMSSSDSESESGKLQRKIPDSDTKIKSKQLPGRLEKMEKTSSVKPKPRQMEQKPAALSSDSESSDNFDNFISQFSGGASKSSFGQKAVAKSIYSTSESSDNEAKKTKLSKTKVKILSKSERYDSDKSDHSAKKQPLHPKISSDSTKLKSKSKKTAAIPEKSPKKAEKSSKVVKSSGKEKKQSKAQSLVHDSESDESYITHAEEKMAMRLFRSDNDESSSSDEDDFLRGRKSPPLIKKKSTKLKKQTETSAEDRSSQKVKKSKLSRSPEKKNVRKMSSSSMSSDSSDYSPPPLSSSLLTVETIKDETVIPSKYILESLDSSEWSQKSSKSSLPPIYTSSDSSAADSDLDDSAFQEISTEDKKRFFGSSGSSEELDVQKEVLISKPSTNRTKSEPKRSSSSDWKEKKNEKDMKSTLPSRDTKDAGEVLKVSKSASKAKDSKKEVKSTKHFPSIEKAKHGQDHKQKSSKKEEKNTTDVKISKEKQETSTIKLKSHEQKIHKKVKQGDEKQRKQSDQLKPAEEKSKKTIEVHKEDKQKSEKVSSSHEKPRVDKPDVSTKSESSKPRSKMGHKEKKGKPEQVEKHEDRPKAHKDGSKMKQKHKDHSHMSHSKDQTEKKDAKTLKHRDHEQTKVKKEIKGKSVQEKSSSEQKNPTVSAKPEKKKVPRPDKVKVESIKDSDDLILPSVRVDKDVEYDEPGRSFFYSDSSDEEKSEGKTTNLKFAESQSKINQDITKQSDLKSKESYSEPSPVQKSMFSPKDNRYSSSSFEDDPITRDDSSSRQTFASHHCASPTKTITEKRKNVEEFETEEDKSAQSSSENAPAERTKRLSSYEKYKMERERHQEHIKELKKLSQQRDEEAVRSITAGDVAADDTVSDEAKYLDDTDVSVTLEEPTDLKAESAATPLRDDASADNRPIKNPTPEPRSLAEEDELAAALRSIEGFGDFHSEAKTESAPPSTYQQPMYEQTVKEVMKDDVPEAARVDEEAASAASALLEETTSYEKQEDTTSLYDKHKKSASLYEKEKKATSSNDDVGIQLPSVRYEDNASQRRISSVLAEPDHRKPVQPDEVYQKTTKSDKLQTNYERRPGQIVSDKTPHEEKAQLSSVQRSGAVAPMQENPTDSPKLKEANETEMTLRTNESAPRISDPVALISEPTSRISEPASRINEPASRTGEPVSRLKEPASRLTEPVSRLNVPVSRIIEPVSRTAEPISRTVEPVSRTAEPISRTGEPVSRINEPISRVNVPVSRINEPVFPPRPFVSLPTSREQSIVSGSNRSELTPVTQREPLSQTQPPVVSRRPSADLHPAPPHQGRTGPVKVESTRPDVPGPAPLVLRPSIRTSAPIHETPIGSKTPQASPPVTSGLHISPTSKSQISPGMIVPVALPSRNPASQERPQGPAHAMHRLPQQLPMYPSPSATSHAVAAPTTNLIRDASGLDRAPHLSIPSSAASAFPPMVKTSLHQPYQPPSSQRSPVLASSGVPTFHPPVSTVTSVHDPSKEQGGGGGPTQAGSKPPLLTHYAPHHSMFYSGQNFPMYPLPGGLPFSRPQFARFNVPFQIPHTHPSQHQPPQAGHVFQGRATNPYADISQEMLLSQRLPTQPQEADKPRQPSPSSGVVRSYNAPQPQDYPIKMHTPAPTRPAIVTQEPPTKSMDVRPSFTSPSEGSSRPSISMEGDSMALLERHFEMSGYPATSSVSSLPSSAAVQIRSAPPGTRQHRPPGKSLSPNRNPTLPQTMRQPVPRMHPEPFCPPSTHVAKEPTPRPQQSAPNMPPLDPTKTKLQPSPIYDTSYQQRRARMNRTQSAQREESQQDNLQDLFERYPVIWQGKLALKNDFAAVQIHFVAGNLELGHAGLPKNPGSSDSTGMAELRIVQRMRTNAEQMSSLHDRMTRDEECSFLLALPCGRDRNDVVFQTEALRTGFIQYLQQKEVAGIVNVESSYGRAQNKLVVVLHVFPPSDFTSSNLQYRAPDLLSNVADIEHLLIVVTPG